MHWEGAMIGMLRVVIDDNAYQGSYTYTDSRLVQVLVTAAMYVNQEVEFDTDYTIDVIDSSISPDPYDHGDNLFLNMVVMKAACIIDQGVFREKALLAGLSANCGPASLNTSQHLAGFKDLLKMGPCAIYSQLKDEHKFSSDKLNSLIHFVLSPFVGNEFDPSSLGGNGFNDRMIR